MKKAICIAAIVALLVTFLPTSQPAQATSGLRVAIYAGLGARADSIMAVSRMFAAMGDTPEMIRVYDLSRGRVTAANFDLLVIPDGEDGRVDGYNTSVAGYGGNPGIQNFVQSGGGLLAIGAGAMYISSGCTGCMNWYPGTATQDLTNSTFTSIGKGYAQIKVTDSQFGLNDRYSLYVPNYAPNITVTGGATKVAEFTMGVDNGKAAAIRWTYGSGRVMLIAPEPSVDGQGDLDWTAWDQTESQGYNPQMAWPLVAKAVEWLCTGAVPNNTTINPGSISGKRVAVYSTHTPDGGAYGAMLPPIGRMIEYSGDTPLAVRDVDIKNGKLVGANYDGVVFPGGYAAGYWTQLSGYEANVRNFISGGAGYLGICAGSYYAADRIVWQGTPYNYPLNLYSGRDIGDLGDIVTYPGYELTPIQFLDTTFWNGTLQQYYSAGPYHELAAGATNVAKYAYTGQYANQSAVIRFNYGRGKVYMSGVHPEMEEGSLNDWAYWDAYKDNSDVPLNDPDSEWPYMTNVFNWLLKSGGAAPSFGGNMIPLAKGASDNTSDSIGDAQRADVSGSPPTSDARNNGWYGVKRNTMDLTGFGINKSGTFNSVTLKVKYSARPGYNGTQYVQWSTDGTNWYNTTIKPLNNQRDIIATYNLKAAGVGTWDKIRSLRIKFSNSTNYTVGFDYVWVAAQ